MLAHQYCEPFWVRVSGFGKWVADPEERCLAMWMMKVAVNRHICLNFRWSSRNVYSTGRCRKNMISLMSEQIDEASWMNHALHISVLLVAYKKNQEGLAELSMPVLYRYKVMQNESDPYHLGQLPRMMDKCLIMETFKNVSDMHLSRIMSVCLIPFGNGLDDPSSFTYVWL